MSNIGHYYNPCVTELGAKALEEVSSISFLELPNCIRIANGALYNCSNLSTISMQNLVILGTGALIGARSLSVINAPKLQSIGSYLGGSNTGLSNLRSIRFDTLCSLSIFYNVFYSVLEELYAPELVCLSFSKIGTPWAQNLSSLNVGSLAILIGSDAFKYAKISSFYASKLNYVPSYCFHSCISLSDVTLGKVAVVNDYAFASTSVSSFNFESCRYIGNAAFSSTRLQGNVNLNSVLCIESDAFLNCDITGELALEAYYIGISAFYNNSITAVTCSNIRELTNSVFCNNKNLERAVFDNVMIVNSAALAGCEKLSEISIPNTITISDYAFRQCSLLKSVNFKKCKRIGIQAFSSCWSLSKASFGELLYMGNSTFNNCSSLSVVVFAASVSCNILATAFGSTPIIASSYLGYFGSIYVRSSLISLYSGVLASYMYNRLAPLETLEISFAISNLQQSATWGLSWGSWITTSYNVDAFQIINGSVFTSDGVSYISGVSDGDLITEEGMSYTLVTA